MHTRPIHLVKIGGSLLDWPELPGRLLAFLAEETGERTVFLAGGGGVVDVLRDLDAAHGLGEERSHDLALRALDLTAAILAAIVPGLVAVTQPDEMDSIWAAGRTPVFAPRRYIEQCESRGDVLPHRWDVTSDSIAARIATRMGATGLTLLKSAPIPDGADRRDAARLGLVDACFPEEAAALGRVAYRNLRGPDPASDIWI